MWTFGIIASIHLDYKALFRIKEDEEEEAKRTWIQLIAKASHNEIINPITF